MRLLSDKITGNVLPAEEWNDVPKEIENVITTFGQSLSSGDLNQLGKNIAAYVAGGTFYADSGAANAYILTAIVARQVPISYIAGFSAQFITTNPNTLASTVNVASLGVKDIKTPGGNDPAPGDISNGVILRFDSSSDNFILLNPKVSGAQVVFKLLQDMIDDTTLVPGMTARILNRVTDDDVGGNDYFIVAAGTGVDDGGAFIDLNTHQAKGIFGDGEVRVEQYGAIGDNIAIDNTTALNNANKNTIRKLIIYQDKTYSTTGTVLFPSGREFRGLFNNTIILSLVDNQPVMASQSWDSSEGVVPTGELTIIGIKAEGLESNLNQIGVILRDFDSNFINVSAIRCGGGGILATDKDDINVTTPGSLVNNRFENPVVRACGKIGLDIGEPGNVKLTDFFIHGGIISMNSAGTQHLHVGTAAGSLIENMLFEGNPTADAVQLENCNNTRFIGCRIASYIERALVLNDTQGSVSVLGLHVGADSANQDSRVIDIGGSAVPNTTVSAVMDVNVKLVSNTTGIIVIHNQAGVAEINATVATNGVNRGLLQFAGGLDAGRTAQIRIMSDATVVGKFTDKANASTQVGIEHSGLRLGYSMNSTGIDGNSPAVVVFNIKLGGLQELLGSISVVALTSNIAPVISEYRNNFIISSKTNGVDPWVIVPFTPSVNTGFSSSPVLSVLNTSGDDGTLTISFTFSSALATGLVNVKI